MAKRLGARWDPSVKRWYCPPGSALAKVYSWRKASGTTSNHRDGSAVKTMPCGVVAAGQTTGIAGSQLSLLG